MSLIARGKPGRDDGGYTRLLGNSALGALISRTHGASISAGTELEKLLLARCQCLTAAELPTFLQNPTEGIFVVRKKVLKETPFLDGRQEPDLLILKVVPNERHCFVVELKDGDEFDTKKSDGERDSLYAFRDHIAAHIAFTVSVRVCAFNVEDRQRIVKGFKGRITEDEAITGRELCHLLGVDYDEIVQLRKTDQQANFAFFLDELLRIPEVREELEARLSPSEGGGIDLIVGWMLRVPEIRAHIEGYLFAPNPPRPS